MTRLDDDDDCYTKLSTRRTLIMRSYIADDEMKCNNGASQDVIPSNKLLMTTLKLP